MSTQLSNRCRTSLYRVIFGKPNSNEERIVFLMAGSREAASKRATSVLAALFDIEPLEVYLYNLASFVDLIDSGVSWKGPMVSVWAEHPLFLTDDSSLLGKWAGLYADLASATAVEAIRRARS
jgi:hypothetical protein